MAKLTKKALREKLRAMVLMGAYGDALGAAHEAAGLAGNIGKVPCSLQPVRSYHQEEVKNPWFVWPLPSELRRLRKSTKRGVFTDDTAYRLTQLQPWLCHLESQGGGKKSLTEASFEQWMRKRLEQVRDPKEPEFVSRNRDAMIRAWLVMLKDARAWQTGPKRKPKDFKPSPGNPFYHPGYPAVFGLFMYLEAAALFYCCPPEEVYAHFSRITILDNPDGCGGEVTGLLAAVLAQAVCVEKDKNDFSQWFFATIDKVLESAPKDKRLKSLTVGIRKARRLGERMQGKTSEEFLNQVKRQIYSKYVPKNKQGLEPFNPCLFLEQIVAAVAYGGKDILKSLCALANNPGDADTLPSFLGSIVGAWCGLSLSEGNAGLKKELILVEECMTSLFQIKLKEQLDCLCKLAVRFCGEEESAPPVEPEEEEGEGSKTEEPPVEEKKLLQSLEKKIRRRLKKNLRKEIQKEVRRQLKSRPK